MAYTMGMHPAVFLDLDNTIVHDTGAVPDPDELTLMQGAAPAIASLRGLGYRVVVVANHEAVARGRLSEDGVHALHARVAELVGQTANGAVIDAFYYCPYHPKGSLKQYKKDHANRKPKPGMLKQAAKEMDLDLATSWMIGDELADIQAGRAAGTRTILLRADADRLRPIDPSELSGAVAEAPDKDRPSGPDFYAVGLVDAARLIAQQPRVEAAEAKRGKEPGRKWDAEKIAKIQVARPKPAVAKKPETAAAARAFRPWGAPTEEDDGKPIVAKPFRKRPAAREPKADTENAAPREPSSVATAAPAIEPSATPIATAPAPAAAPQPQAIPDNIRQAIDNKKQASASGTPLESSTDKTLRLILQELRAQRGTANEFSYLTIIAVALQLVAIVCLLGGLFMGGNSDALFFRWLGAGVMAQLLAISTLLHGR